MGATALNCAVASIFFDGCIAYFFRSDTIKLPISSFIIMITTFSQF